MQSCEGMQAEATREYVADLVTQQLNVPGFELLPEQVRCLLLRISVIATRLGQCVLQCGLLRNFLLAHPIALPSICQPDYCLPCLPACRSSSCQPATRCASA
jgi:hypothetical protein